jgi:hypothetical protein
MHAHIQRYCGDDGREGRLPQSMAVEVVQKLLHQVGPGVGGLRHNMFFTAN